MTQPVSSDVGADDIAIVGMALTVPGASDLASFWQNLITGTESITRLSDEALLEAGEDPARLRHKTYVPAAAILEGFDTFDAEFFGFGPKEAAILDPQHRKFLEVSWQAMEQAGHAPGRFDGTVGVFAGCGMGSYFYFNICSNPDLVEDVGMFLLRHTGTDKDFLSTRVSHVFDLKGPSINVQTACSTSLVAVHYARQALLSGECDMALAGGVTIELPQGRGYLFKENEILSPDGHCHAFDHRAEGTVFGSGAGAVALRRLSDAVADGDHIWAVIKGSAINNDGAAKAGYLAPSVDGQAAAIRRALKVAGVGADSIDYVECHGTGTYLGDPIEVAAMTEAFRTSTASRGSCAIGSVKSNIGHLDTAAGVVGLIKTSLALHHARIPPSLNYEAPNPTIDFANSPFRVADRLTNWPDQGRARRAGVNSLGVGGTNAHVVLEQAPARAPSDDSDWPFHVLCVSAHGKAALEANSQALAAHLRAHPEQPLADIAHTLKNGRAAHAKRRVVVAETHDEAADLLAANDPQRVFTHDALGAAPETVFMFPGGGAQYPDMARDLYETEPVFAEWMDRGLAHLQPQLDYDIRALWLPEPDARAAAAVALRKPSVQLPLIMIVEYALAQLWLSWGVRPAALVGHSMGENTAACLAGVIGFEDCIDLVLLRGRLFDRVPAGGMLSVSLPEAQVRALIGEDLDVASVNAPDLCAVSGPQDRLDALQAVLEGKGIEFQRVAIDIAAHSRMLDPILPEFRTFLQGITLSAPKLPFMSNRTGQLITAQQASDPEYWVQQLRNTVLFADCIAALADGPARVFLEVGPGKALSALTQMSGHVKPAQVLSSLRHPDHAIADDVHFLGLIGRLWACGVEADWDQIWGGARRNRVLLPGYQFQRSRYFIEPGKVAQTAPRPALTRQDDIADWGYRVAWRPELALCDLDVEGDLSDSDPLTWLVFSDDAGVADKVVARLRGAGHKVTTLRPGDSFHRHDAESYTLAPEAGAGGYEALLAGLAADDRLPGRIAHFWLVTRGETFRPGSSFFDRNMVHGFDSLFHLAQAIGGADLPAGCHLSVITTGAAQLRDEPLSYPEKACIAGPVGVIPREFPGLTAASLDIELPQRDCARRWCLGPNPAPAGDDSLTNRLLEDLLAAPANTVAAYRGARRMVRGLKPVTLGAQDAPVWVQGGTYLITGGFGGIGLSVARDLAQQAGAEIILLSRKPFPERAEWDRASGPDVARIAAVRAVESLGATVRVMQGDVTDIDRMRAIAAGIGAGSGRLNGIIHAAGVIDDGPLLGKGMASIQAVMGPKINGLRVLDEVFPDGSVDLLVLFSSTSTLTRPAGQVDYIAANEYLNAYAQSRSGGATRVVALNWGVWADVGMAAEAMAARSAVPARAPLSQPLLSETSVGRDGTTRFHATLDGRAHWVLSEHRSASGAMLLPGTGYIELAAEAMAGRPFALQDLNFLRPLDVAEGASRDVTLHLDGDRLEIRAACRVEGRAATVLTAQARIMPLNDAKETIDIDAISRRCAQQLMFPYRSPQLAHLDFGPRWDVVRRAAFGEAEGLAHLVLPEAAGDDLADGYLAHPALLDLATGWAIALHPGYDPAHLWVPVSYGAVQVHGPLPAEVFSHIRLSDTGADGDGTASFDITLCDATGAVLLGAQGFQMRRLEGGFTLPALGARDVEFDRDDTAPLSEREEQLMQTIAMGIRADEGPEALRRALNAGHRQIAISSIDPNMLIDQAEVTDRAGAGHAQSFARPDLDSDFVAPQTPAEDRLAGIWQGLLGIDQIGTADSFFDLGGHSLLAVRLFAQIKREFGVQFPISVLFEAPTIARLTALIVARGGLGVAAETARPADDAPSADTGPARRHLVALHPSRPGTGAPLFIVAGMFGNVLNLRHLGLLLGTGRPVYGLQARGLMGEDAPHRTMAEAAADYIAEMRQVQPHGPYYLSGFSGGGITAYEIAQQLDAAGDEVAVMALLDTPLPVRQTLTVPDKMLIKLQEIRKKGGGYLLEWARNRVQWEITRRRDQGAPGVETGAFDNAGVAQAFRHAAATYQVQPWQGPITLLRPRLDRHWKVSRGQWVSREREYVHSDNQWTRLAPRLEVIEVPGDHDSMVLMPNVSALARHLESLIAAARPGRAIAPHPDAAPDWGTRIAAE